MLSRPVQYPFRSLKQQLQVAQEQCMMIYNKPKLYRLSSVSPYPSLFSFSSSFWGFFFSFFSVFNGVNQIRLCFIPFWLLSFPLSLFFHSILFLSLILLTETCVQCRSSNKSKIGKKKWKDRLAIWHGNKILFFKQGEDKTETLGKHEDGGSSFHVSLADMVDVVARVEEGCSYIAIEQNNDDIVHISFSNQKDFNFWWVKAKQKKTVNVCVAPHTCAAWELVHLKDNNSKDIEKMR